MSNSAPTRVAIVTGGSRGIGRQAAQPPGAEGFALLVNFARHRSGGGATVEAITKNGGQAIAIQADVADEAAVAALYDTTEETYGGVDVVVHAAGIMLAPIPMTEMDLADFDRQVRTNLRGTYVVDQEAA